MASPNYNARNPAVKRIMQEIREMNAQQSTEFIAEAMEYPFKPPAFMMLSPSGRFETNMKICLSISSHHPEHWQPSWSVRTALMALIAFMPSPAGGALGALDFSKEERQKMAARAMAEPPKFGSAERQRLIDDMHNRMLNMAQEPAEKAPQESSEATDAALPDTAAKATAPDSSNASPPATADQPTPAPSEATPTSTPTTAPATSAGSQPTTAPAPTPTPASAPATAATATPTPQPAPTPAAVSAAPHSVRAAPQPAATLSPEEHLRRLQQQQLEELKASDRGLSLVAVALLLGIAAILMRKVLVATGFGLEAFQE
eukprot:gene17773-24147_t